jgi:selenide,water dikinase
VPAGSRSNLEFIEPSLRGRDGLGSDGELALLLASDAQTSGGLLLAVPAGGAAELVADLRGQGLPAAEVGELLAPDADAGVGTIELRFAR